MQAQMDQNAPHLVVGVQFASDLPEPAVRHVMNHLGNKVSGLLGQGEFIDFIVIENELNLPVAPASDALVYKR